jgi:hypothetical protein
VRARIACLALMLGVACGGPLGPFPGGELTGELRPAPPDWKFAADVKQAQLETNPADPRSVNIWLATLNGALYLSTSLIRGPKLPTERAWVRDVEADDRVRLRIESNLYELRAARVRDAQEATTARTVLERKYDLDPDDTDPDREVWIYRLDPR